MAIASAAVAVASAAKLREAGRHHRAKPGAAGRHSMGLGAIASAAVAVASAAKLREAGRHHRAKPGAAGRHA